MGGMRDFIILRLCGLGHSVRTPTYAVYLYDPEVVCYVEKLVVKSLIEARISMLWYSVFSVSCGFL